MKSRILPLACCLVLCAGSLAAAGSMLWNARIREVLQVTGELVPVAAGNGQRDAGVDTIIAFVPLSGFSGRELAALQPGREIRLGAAGKEGEIKAVAGRVLRVEQQAEDRLLMSFDKTSAAALAGHAGTALPLTLTVRNKRLLLAALEKI
jgi:hypothetical protein